MSELTLVIGNKNYSSWSLRPWILMKRLGMKFREVVIPLYTPTAEAEIRKYSPSGRVPVLRDGPLCVWDSLAICEYVAELTERGWPLDPPVRAVARSACAEMHSGFNALRAEWPMNARARNRRTVMTPGLRADIERIDAIWNDCRARFGGSGAWLFGDYSIADAMYAPVALRFNTYGAEVSDVARAYVTTALEDATLQDWIRAAEAEPWTMARAEVG